MRIALTRPQAEGERSASLLRARGHDVLLAPLMRVEPVAADLAGDWSAVVVTSGNAPLAARSNQGLMSLPVFAVGARSAEAARKAGFTDVTSADGDAHGLIRLIAARHRDPKPLLYLAGEDRAADLVSELARRGITAAVRIVYRTVTASFPAALADALRAGTLDAVLHYSKRSAENYVAGAREAGIVPAALGIRHVCLSVQVAAPLQAAGAANVAVAKQPDEAAIVELLGPSGG
ncbi:MAG TPA: uroporphyrinogen-III synthase [Pseudolabrys sp.]|nr:uroporphyrinogen-III synthase [Pseudolabrys sp.]